MYKQILCVIVLMGSAAGLGQSYSGGNGTTLSPYLISKSQDWQQLSVASGDWGKVFRLTRHLDLSGVPVVPVGNWPNPFSGTFDGNGFSILNLSIQRPQQSYVGLFGYVGATGRIENLGLAGATVRGVESVGALAGRNHGVIVGCYVWGNVGGSSWDVGGLVGSNVGGAIAESYADCLVTSTSDYVGGLVGYHTGDLIVNSYAAGRVSGNSHIGGLVGSNDMGRLIHSYATAIVTGNESVGGLVGHNFNCYIEGSFWDIHASGQPTSAGGIGASTEQMQSASLFINAGWDFWSVWRLSAGSYPRLRSVNTLSEPTPGDLNRDGNLNLKDAALLAKHWMRTNCTAPDWCGGADINQSGSVGIEDLGILTDTWLIGL